MPCNLNAASDGSQIQTCQTDPSKHNPHEQGAYNSDDEGTFNSPDVAHVRQRSYMNAMEQLTALKRSMRRSARELDKEMNGHEASTIEERIASSIALVRSLQLENAQKKI